MLMFVFSAVVSTVQPTHHGLTLDEVYARAKQQSEMLAIKTFDIEMAKVRYDQLVALALPSLRIIGGARLSDGLKTFETHLALDESSGISANTTNDNFRYDLRLNARVPLFNGFLDRYAKKAGKLAEELQTSNYEKAQQQLYLDVTEFFYQIVWYTRDLEQVDALIQALEKRCQELAKRIHLGKSRRSELLSAQSERATALLLRTRIQGFLNETCAIASYFLDIPKGQLTLKDNDVSMQLGTLLDYTKSAETPPDVKYAFIYQKYLDAQLLQAKAAHWPSLSLEANYYVLQSPQSRDWTILLTLDLPLFEGGLTRARIEEQKLHTLSGDLNVRATQKAFNRDVSLAYERAMTKNNELLDYKTNTALLEQTYQLLLGDYQQGITNHIEVLRALERVYDHRRALVAAEIALKRAVIQLQVTAGLLPVGTPP